MADDDVVFEVRMDRKTFENLRRTVKVRALVASEGGGLIDAFAFRFVASVDAGLPSYYFKQKVDVT